MLDREKDKVQEAVREMQLLDVEARKPGFSKEKAKKRKEEIKKYLRKQGIQC